MKLKQNVWLLIVGLLLAGCGSFRGEISPTPTPFSTSGEQPQKIIGETPVPISLAHLANNPELFEGAILELRGEFKRLPRLVCARDPYPSPSTWGILQEGFLANAAGYDTQLRSLLSEGQQIAVQGRWLHFQGPVGCGKSARDQDIWYLSITRILEPHPLARATAIPGIAAAPATTEVEEPTPDFELTSAFQPTEEIIEPSPTLPEFPATTSPTNTLAQPTITAIPSPSATNDLTLSPAPTISGTGNPPGTIPATTSITATPTISGTLQTVTATATQSGQTGTPTSTPSNGGIADMGLVDFEDLRVDFLPVDTVHRWSFTVVSGSAITITVAPATNANILLSVLGPDNAVLIDRQDQSGVGEVETITNFALTQSGTHKVEIRSAASSGTDYALMVMDNESYSFIFKGILTANQQRADTLRQDNDHFWFFPAMDGDSIGFTVTPGGQEDPYIELYGPDGARLITVDETAGGEAETLTGYSILASGLYGIRVGEFDFGSMPYQIVYTEQ